MVFKHILLATIHIICITAVCDRDLLQRIEWSGAPYNWRDNTIKALYKSTGRLVSKNNLATRAVIYEGVAYLAFPRFKRGIPASLAQVSLRATGSEASLSPFPCWVTQEESSCSSIQSAVDVYRDVQDCLWVLDTGVVHTLRTPLRRCPPKVIAYSLKTGKLLKRIDLSGLVSEASRLQYIVCEYSRGRPYIYISDAATRSILVFDVLANRGYRVVLPKVITQRRDVLYLALVRKGCGNNYLIFTYLSSKRVFSIRTDYLRSGSTAGRIVDLGVKPKKMVILGTDRGSAIFFRYEGQPEIYRWDTSSPFKQENFLVVYKSESCFLATHVIADDRVQRMRVLESNFGDYIQDTVGCGAVQRLSVLASE